MLSGTTNPATDSFLVLLLHAIADIDSEMAVGPRRLREQLTALLSRGYRGIKVSEAVAHLQNGTRPADPSFVITFDDGYLNNLTEGLPILEALKLPATVFVTTGLIDETSAPPWRSTSPSLLAHYDKHRKSFAPLSWDGVKTLAASGLVSIGSHTLTHPLVGTLSEQQMKSELVGSREILEDRIGQEVLDFSYPFGVRQYGAYSEASDAVARGEAAYRCTFSAEVGRPKWASGPWLIPRIPLTNDDRGIDAIAKAAGAYDWTGIAQRTFQRAVANPHGPPAQAKGRIE